MNRVETLTIDHGQMPAIALREVGYRSISAKADEAFQIELSAHGLTAERNLNIHDVEAIRDWCNEVLGAAAALQAAE